MISLPAYSLRAAVDAVIGACAKNSTLPILQQILLHVRGGCLTLTATDLERQITTTVPLDQASGHVGDGPSDAGHTLPGHKLHGIARALDPETSVTLKETSAGQITLTAGRSRYRMHSLSGADYPGLDDTSATPQRDNAISIAPKRLAALLRGIIPAMGKSDVRYYLNGLYLARDGGRLDMVATDGHRLAHHALDAAAEDDSLIIGPDALLQPVILPAETVITLAKLVDPKTDGHIDIACSERTAAIGIGSTLLHSKLVDGRYPDWTRVIPRDLRHEITIARAPLAAALDSMGILSEDKTKSVRLTFSRAELRMQSANADQEEATTSLDYSRPNTTLPSSEDPDHPSPAIGFNSRYLLDAVNGGTTEDIAVHLTDADTSIIIQNGDSDESVFVVMPMRI